MGKTDKDRPYYIRARDIGEEFHRHADWRGNPLECDLYDDHRNDRWQRRNNCGWTLPYCFGGVPSAYVSLVYHWPQRRQERDACRDAMRDWNANGDTDIEPEPRQARNSARWMWW